MVESTQWTDAGVGAAIRHLSQSQTTAQAASLFSVATGRRTSPKALAHLLKRRGLGVPGDYLRRHDVIRPVAPVPPFAFDPFVDRILIVPDTHVPFQDERAFNVMLEAAKIFKPTTIVILGDFADFYSVSFHSKSPSRSLGLAEEVAAVRAQLSRLDELHASRKVYVAGNHEYRLERYLTEKAPALFGCVDVQTLFGLRESGWEWVPYREHIQIGKIFFTHDTGAAGRDAHIRAGATFEHSVAIGHVHRLATHYFGNAAGESHVAASLGWLGDRKQIDYMHPIKVYKDWHLGFGVAYVEPTGITHLSAIPIIDYKAVMCGQLVAA